MEERESEEESLLHLLPRLPSCHFAKLTRSSFSTVPKVLLLMNVPCKGKGSLSFPRPVGALSLRGSQLWPFLAG